MNAAPGSPSDLPPSDLTTPRDPDTVTASLPPWNPREQEEEAWYSEMQALEGREEFEREEEAWRNLAIKMEETKVATAAAAAADALEAVKDAVVRLAAARITAASKAAVARGKGSRQGGGGRRRRNSKSKKGNSGLAHVKATKTRRTRVRLSGRF